MGIEERVLMKLLHDLWTDICPGHIMRFAKLYDTDINRVVVRWQHPGTGQWIRSWTQ